MAVNLDSVKEALTHKYGPLPGYAWAGIGAAAIVVVASRRSKSAATSPAFLTTPPPQAVTGPTGGLGAAGGAPDPALGFGEPNPNPGDPTPLFDPAGQPNQTIPPTTIATGGGGGSAGGSAGGSGGSTVVDQPPPPALITAAPLPALAPYADQLVARGVDPSTGGLLPGAGNSSGVPGSPIAYGPGLYDQTPTVATPDGPVPGGVFRASDPTDFVDPGPQNATAVVQPVLAAPAAPAAPSGESLIAMHYRLGRDTLDV